MKIPSQTGHVEDVPRALQNLGVMVDNGYVVSFFGEVTRQGKAHFSVAYNYYFHCHFSFLAAASRPDVFGGCQISFPLAAAKRIYHTS